MGATKWDSAILVEEYSMREETYSGRKAKVGEFVVFKRGARQPLRLSWLILHSSLRDLLLPLAVQQSCSAFEHEGVLLRISSPS